MKKILQLACCCGVLCLGAAADEEADLRRFADGLYGRGMHALAVQEYEALLEAYPQHAEADVVIFRMGECYRHMGQASAAERQYRRVFTGFPESSFRFRAGFRRALLFLDAEQYSAAADLFQAVLAQNPPPEMEAASLYFVGESQRKGGEEEAARDAFLRVLSAHAESTYGAYALLNLGEMEAAAGKPDKALERFMQVVERPAGDRIQAEALFQVAELHFREQRFEQSAEAYRRLLNEHAADQRAAESRLQAAWALHNAGYYAESLEQCRLALSEDEVVQRDEWLYLKANCRRQLMQNDAAAVAYAELVQAFPGSRYANAARYEKALTLYRSGDHRGAIESVRQVKAEGELQKDVYWLLAESHSALGDDESAIQFYRLLTRDFPASDVAADATYRLAHHLQKQNNRKEAARYYTLLVERYPENKLAPQALFAAAASLAAENQTAEAVRDWGRLVRDFPGHELVEEALYQKAVGEARLERHGDAVSSLRALIHTFPQTRFLADAHFWLGIMLYGGGQYQDAEQAFRRALQANPRAELEREASFHLGVTLQRLGRNEDAAERFQPLLAGPVGKRFGEELLEWLSAFQFEQGRTAEAMDAARFLVDMARAPEWRQIGWSLLGHGYLATGEDESAEAVLRKAMETGARTRYAAESALRLGDLVFAAGRTEEAGDWFRKAAAMSQSERLMSVRANAYAGLARTASAQGNAGEAARYYMSVAVLYDDDELVPECLYEAARAFAADGQAAASAQAEKELLARYPLSEWAARLSGAKDGTAEGAQTVDAP